MLWGSESKQITKCSEEYFSYFWGKLERQLWKLVFKVFFLKSKCILYEQNLVVVKACMSSVGLLDRKWLSPWTKFLRWKDGLFWDDLRKCVNEWKFTTIGVQNWTTGRLSDMINFETFWTFFRYTKMLVRFFVWHLQASRFQRPQVWTRRLHALWTNEFVASLICFSYVRGLSIKFLQQTSPLCTPCMACNCDGESERTYRVVCQQDQQKRSGRLHCSGKSTKKYRPVCQFRRGTEELPFCHIFFLLYYLLKGTMLYKNSEWAFLNLNADWKANCRNLFIICQGICELLGFHVSLCPVRRWRNSFIVNEIDLFLALRTSELTGSECLSIFLLNKWFSPVNLLTNRTIHSSRQTRFSKVKRLHDSHSFWPIWSSSLFPGVTCPIGLRARLTRVNGARPVDPCPIGRPHIPIDRGKPPNASPVVPRGNWQACSPPPLPLGYSLLTHARLTCLQMLVLQGIFYTPSTDQEKVL